MKQVKRSPEEALANRHHAQDEDDKMRHAEAEALNQTLARGEHELASLPSMHVREIYVPDYYGVKWLPHQMPVAADLTRNWPSYYDEQQRRIPPPGLHGPPQRFPKQT